MCSVKNFIHSSSSLPLWVSSLGSVRISAGLALTLEETFWKKKYWIFWIGFNIEWDILEKQLFKILFNSTYRKYSRKKYWIFWIQLYRKSFNIESELYIKFDMKILVKTMRHSDKMSWNIRYLKTNCWVWVNALCQRTHIGV